jgi:hypothetical protein
LKLHSEVEEEIEELEMIDDTTELPSPTVDNTPSADDKTVDAEPDAEASESIVEVTESADIPDDTAKTVDESTIQSTLDVEVSAIIINLFTRGIYWNLVFLLKFKILINGVLE